MRTYLDFEKPIAELETKVAELRALSGESEAVSISDEISTLEAKTHDALQSTYAKRGNLVRDGNSCAMPLPVICSNAEPI